jgi:hypothetical protein
LVNDWFALNVTIVSVIFGKLNTLLFDVFIKLSANCKLLMVGVVNTLFDKL